MQKWNNGLCGERTALQRQRDTVAGEGINKSGGVTCEEHAVRFGFRFAEIKRRCCDRGKQRLPCAASLEQPRFLSEDIFHSACRIGADHGAGID